VPGRRKKNRGANPFQRRHEPQQIGITESKWTPRKKQSYNHQQKRAIFHQICDWVDGQNLTWTDHPQVGDGTLDMWAVSTRHLVTRLRHDCTTYDEIKGRIDETLVTTVCPTCYAKLFCIETHGGDRDEMVAHCHFGRLARSKLFERATKMVLESLGLEWGDGWVWKQGACGAIAATWGYNDVPELDELINGEGVKA